MNAANGAAPLLEVAGLTKHFAQRRGFLRRAAGVVRAVDDVSFTLGRGETLALVGESGSGKTTLGRMLLRLVPATAGSVRYRPDPGGPVHELFDLAPARMRALRRELQIVFQDPYASLNPRLTAGAMLAEVLRVHRVVPADLVAERAGELLERVGLARRRAACLPHEFSGGERQRLAIARALAVEPRLIVCDEPVASLDLSLQAQVLNLLRDLQAELGIAYLLIAHDLSVVRSFADRVAVMYAGRIVESGTTEDVFERAAHPYTRALLSAVPSVAGAGARIPPRIPLGGEPASAAAVPGGCRFHPRCPLAEARCVTLEPLARPASATHAVACHLAGEDA